ncbi:MAG: 3-oxoacyl-ACP reductase FabG [Oscillospiraceae bacterium]
MSNKTVIVTGASKGIGLETAKLFAEKGWNVAINYNKTAKTALELCDKINEQGGNAIAVKADISKREDVVKLFSEAINKFGKIDCLVNNAGIAQQKLFTDLTDDDINIMLDTNLKGTIYACQEAAKYMLKNHSGSIVNISSIYGISGGSCEVHYSAAKAGVIGLTKALAKELGPSNIRVNCVAPGAIDTPMNSHLDEETIGLICEETPLGRMGKSREVADTIFFLAEDTSSYITGQIISPNGGSVI